MGSITQKRVLLLLLTLLISLVLIYKQVAASPGQDPASWTPARDKVQTNQGNLVDHGSVVANTNKTFAIYWLPNTYSYSANYQRLINSFFVNVAADSGKNTNVYYAATQYSTVQYNSTFGGFFVDTNPFPSSGCTNTAFRVCLSDAQIQSEISRVMTAQGWSPGLTNFYFLFTPANVTSCFTSGAKCAYTDYCAYHNSYLNSNSNTVVYSSIPYVLGGSGKCDNFQHPNGDAADGAINLISNEHNQMMSDPTRNGWYDTISYEQAEKCAWNFGTSLGWTVYGKYNQVINGAKYWLQGQWSNQTSRCVWSGL